MTTPLTAFGHDTWWLVLGKALSDLSGVQAGQVCDPSSTNSNPFSTLASAGGNCFINNNVQGPLQIANGGRIGVRGIDGRRS